MDQRRPHSHRPQPHHYNKRRHVNSNLNPAAHDFIPSQGYEPGPSHSRDNLDHQYRSQETEEHARSYQNDSRTRHNRRQYGPQETHGPQETLRRDQYSNDVREDPTYERSRQDPFYSNNKKRAANNSHSNNHVNHHHHHNRRHEDSNRRQDVRYGDESAHSRSNARNQFSNDSRSLDHEDDRPNRQSANSNYVRNNHNRDEDDSRHNRQNVRPYSNNNSSREINYKPNNRREHGYQMRKVRSRSNERDDMSEGIDSMFQRRLYLGNSNTDNIKHQDDVDEQVTSQRDKLIQILFKGTQECLVCCERINQVQPVWSCAKCYNILHLVCTQKWASSSHTEHGWRCPACQNVATEVPEVYQCFCKKQVLESGWNRSDTPHSCGEVCNKDLSRGESPCGHRCTLLCHPGPCPICEIVIARYCGCGRTSCQMQCGSSKELTCSDVCNKTLNCERHKCTQVCHTGACQPCDQVIQQYCFCGSNNKQVTCTANIELNYSCEAFCKKQLDCGNHTCTNICHPGPCDFCYLLPQFITTCCCGKTRLTPDQSRSSCVDPIPTCNQECSKTLHCGELDEKHKCKASCHEGDCPPCKLTSIVLCTCRQRKRQIQCSELKADGVVKCNIKCSVMRTCGKHKCNQVCCTQQHHICPLSCNKKLRCGTHKCEMLCHKGPCPACMNVSFEELTCRCGGEVIFPPVPCGTRPPVCHRVCARTHPCDHAPSHTCHAEAECPPCVVFTEKWCYGRHQMRKNIFCYAKSFSCGQSCGKVLKCHRHTCNLPCHEGDCLKTTEKCKQLCSKPRPACGHPCNEVCHPGSCPGSACAMKIHVSCSCGERSETQLCIEDKSLLEQFNKNSKGEYKILECDDTCAQIERNRRLALGLQIRNPDLNLKLKPLYPDLLKQWGKKDPEFCNYVHSKLADLVKLAKESKQRSRSFSFEVMNRDKRQFVHSYCEFFGIESMDCDPEPKRNVLVTAHKDRAWLPGYSLMETIQREKGQPKVPMVPLNKETANTTSRSEMVQLGVRKS